MTIVPSIFWVFSMSVSERFLYADSAFSVLKNDTTISARKNTGNLYNNIAGDYDKIDDYEKEVMR